MLNESYFLTNLNVSYVPFRLIQLDFMNVGYLEAATEN